MPRREQGRFGQAGGRVRRVALKRNCFEDDGGDDSFDAAMFRKSRAMSPAFHRQEG